MGKKHVFFFENELWFFASLGWFAFFLWFPVAHPKGNYATVLNDSEGRLLSAHISGDEQWRFSGPDKLPLAYRQALLEFEDKRFLFHGGLDWVAVGRAGMQNLKARRVMSGGSTLTMQYRRISGQSPSRTIWQKCLEAIEALMLEARWNKGEIALAYAQHAPFGGNVIGLETASWRYFDKLPDALTRSEAALLAVLPNAPGLMHPGKGRKALETKRNRILEKLSQRYPNIRRNLGSDVLEPIPKLHHRLSGPGYHALQWLRKERPGETKFASTLHGGLQARLEAQLALWQAENFRFFRVRHLSVLVAGVKDGAVLAYAANLPFGQGEEAAEVDLIQAPRSPGSTLKPLLYASALEKGIILPKSWLPDVPQAFGAFRPQNYDYRYRGMVPAHLALARSLNIPSVFLLQRMHTDVFLKTLRELGFEHLQKPSEHYGLSLILGGGETSLWELVQAYAFLAQKGWYETDSLHPLHLIQGDNKAITSKAFSAASAYLCLEAMKKVTRPDEEKLWQVLGTGAPIAWKTGTSYGNRDAWSVGLTSDFVVGIWVGNANGKGRPALTGIDMAAPLMFKVFRMLPSSSAEGAIPEDMLAVPVCPISGYRHGTSCPPAQMQQAPANGIRVDVCPFHVPGRQTEDGAYMLPAGCLSGEGKPYAMLLLPPLAASYVYARKPALRPLKPFPACLGTHGDFMAVKYPVPLSDVYLPEVGGSFWVEATHKQELALIYWHLNDSLLGATGQPHRMEIFPKPGTHRLTLTDAQGNQIHRTFTVFNPRTGLPGTVRYE